MTRTLHINEDVLNEILHDCFPVSPGFRKVIEWKLIECLTERELANRVAVWNKQRTYPLDLKKALRLFKQHCISKGITLSDIIVQEEKTL